MNGIEIRQYSKEFYPILCEWFNCYSWSNWDIDGISPYSYIAYLHNIPIAFGSVYLAEGCNFSILGFFISSPEFDKSIRSNALDSILEHIDKIAKEKEYKYIMYSGDSKPLVERLKNHNYRLTDNASAYICIKDLNGEDPKFFYED